VAVQVIGLERMPLTTQEKLLAILRENEREKMPASVYCVWVTVRAKEMNPGQRGYQFE
jgi:hypothetical protein